MYGFASGKKVGIATTAVRPEPVVSPALNGAVGGETHSVGAESSSNEDAQSSASPPETSKRSLGSKTNHEPRSASSSSVRVRNESKQKTALADTAPTPTASDANFTPTAGQMFLQVAAVGQEEAEAVAEVLHKKGFRAHAIPKPGTKLYRVLIGPVRDTSDLSATRDSLRHTGFAK